MATTLKFKLKFLFYENFAKNRLQTFTKKKMKEFPFLKFRLSPQISIQFFELHWVPFLL